MKQHCLQDPDKVEATIVNRKYIYERWYEWIFRFNFRFWTFEASFKALGHFAKDLAEQVGYGCDEVEEGESKEKAKSPTELTYQWVRRENQHLVRKNIMIEEDKSLRLLKRVVTLVCACKIYRDHWRHKGGCGIHRYKPFTGVRWSLLSILWWKW